MTRYTRTKGGTHRKPQAATPWSEMCASKTNTTKVEPHRGASDQSKVIKKRTSNRREAAEEECMAADYRRSKKKKKVPQWKKTEWQMLETGAIETAGLAAELIKIDKDAVNPTKYRPKKKVVEGAAVPKKSIADRLKEIEGKHGTFTSQEKEDIAKFLKQDDRRENRRQKRIEERKVQKTCFNCRQPGHDMAECPKLRKDVEQGTGICFKCGSTEHAVSTCRVKVPAGEFPYAKCFICGEQGHLSKQCPDNPRGLYPNGGCCRGCGSVEHYKKDCPVLLKEQGIDSIKVLRINPTASVDYEESLEEKKVVPTKKKPRVVKF